VVPGTIGRVEGRNHVTEVLPLSDERFGALRILSFGVLIGAFKRARRQAVELRLVVAEPRMLKLFEITGLTDPFFIFATVEEAAAHG